MSRDDRCAACGERTVYEDVLGSDICTHCGTLVNPAQTVLAAHLEHVDVSGHDYSRAAYTGGSTLKGRNGWALAGQDREARDRRNTISMHEYIKSLAGRLAVSGSSVRAHRIFDMAMERGGYRWGRKAKLVAGAALAIALRESSKSDSLRDITYLLDEPHVALTRTFATVVELLQLKLTSADPAQHLPVLENHLRALVQGPPHPASPSPSLPRQLTTVLTPLLPKLPNVRHTATSLSALVMRVPALASLPTAPTACALLILALEGELAASLPLTGALAHALGTRVGAGKTAVMQRYKAVYDVVEECIRDVPWLDAHERKAQGKGRGKGRSKVAKRVVVARGLKDVLQFQDELWKRRLEGVERPVVDVEVEIGEDDLDLASGGASTSVEGCTGGKSPVPTQPVMRRGDALSRPQSRKPRRSPHACAVARVSQFILNPLVPSSSSRLSPSTGRRMDQDQEHSTRPDLLAHLLTADDPALADAFLHPPTRLQLLAAARGGGEGEGDIIADEELFGEGEMEALLRDPGEVAAMRVAMGWEEGGEGSGGERDADENGDEPRGGVRKTQSARRKRKRRAEDGDEDTREEPGKKTTKRIDMGALARLLDPDNHLEEQGYEYTEEDKDKDEEDSAFGFSAPYTLGSDPGEGEVIEEWRPLSPGLGGAFDDSEDRYDT